MRTSINFLRTISFQNLKFKTIRPSSCLSAIIGMFRNSLFFTLVAFGTATLLYYNSETSIMYPLAQSGNEMHHINKHFSMESKIVWKNSTYSNIAVDDVWMNRVMMKATPINIWLAKRKNNLNRDIPRKVILLGYMRGGSTFFSELFIKNPEAIYWYEPLDAFYSSTYGIMRWSYPFHLVFDEAESDAGLKPYLRNYPDWETTMLSDFHHSLVSCKHKELPVELLVHPGTVSRSTLGHYQACSKSHNITGKELCRFGTRLGNIGLRKCGGRVIEANRHACAQKIAAAKATMKGPASEIISQYNISSPLYKKEELNKFINLTNCQSKLFDQLKQYCIADLNSHCNKATLVAYKALRISMDALQSIFERDPDTYVLYLVRDPRGVVYSTKGAGFIAKWSQGRVPLEAKLLCTKMRHDLQMFSIYQKLYPGTIKLVRYEDLAREPNKVSSELYSFIGVRRHPDVMEWILLSKQSGKDGGRSSTLRSNWTASIEKWRKGLSLEDQHEMNDYCKDVLLTLNYPIK